MYRKQIASAAIAAAICISAGCAKKSVSDEGLISAIQSKLYADDSTKSANIKVDVKNGVVTLSGDVPSPDVELEAMKVANGTPGVASVNDQLKVNNAMAGGAPTATDAAGAAASSAASKPAPMAPPPPAAPAPATPAPVASQAPDNAPAATSTPASDVAATPRRREPMTLTVPAGERLQVRMIDAIDSRKNTVGQTFNATLDAPLVQGNRVVIPAGAPVTVLLSNASSAGRVRGRSELQVRVTSITAGGRPYDVASDVYDQAGTAKGKQTAIRSGIGAAAGALIGGLAGGGKGAAIGAGAGGGAGLGYQFFTHGAQVKIPSETVLNFRLSEPLTIQR